MARVALTGKPARFMDGSEAMKRWFDVYAFSGGEDGSNRVAVLFTEISERRKSEEAIKESEQRFRALVNATSDVVYRMSADWTEMRQLEGRGILSDTGEPIKEWLQKYIHPNDRKRVQTAIDEAIRTKSIFELEHQVLQADGTTGWTSSRAIPIFDENGNITEWFGAAADVTERRRAEASLRQATEEIEQRQRLYEAVTANTPDLIYVFDLNYRFTYANEALLTMWGKTWNQAIGNSLLENGYEPWHAEMHEREIDEVIKTKKPIRGEVSFPHATLGRRVYDYIFAPVLNEKGEVEVITGTTRDITDIKNAEDEIRESEERFRTMAESSDILIGVNDETIDAVYFNKKWEELTGKPVEELLKLGWADLLHPDDRQSFLDRFFRAFKNKESYDGEFRILNKEGTYSWLYAKVQVRLHADGSYAGHISSCIDITDRKANEKALQDSEIRIRSVIESAPFPIGVYVGKELKIEFANQSILDVWGKGNDVIGKLYRDILPELENQHIFEQIDRVLTTGIPFHAKTNG